MGPYLLPAFEPLDAGGVEGTKQAFFDAVRRGSVNDADHYFLWLVQNVPHEEALDMLLTVALLKNLIDDHKFIYPVYTWRVLEWLDWETPSGTHPWARALYLTAAFSETCARNYRVD